MEGCPTVLWINLDRSRERRVRMQQMLDGHALNHVRISAIDGKLPIDHLVDWEDGKMTSITNCQYACMMSHLRALRYMMDHTSENIVLVMEDDATLEFLDKWPRPIGEIISQRPKNCQLLQLAYNIGDARKFAGDCKREYIRNRGHYSTLCYAITRKGAMQVLEKFTTDNGLFCFPPHRNPKFYVADVGLYKSTMTYLFICPLFTYPDDDSSTIQRLNNTHQRAKLVSKEVYRLYELSRK